ncbi:hypothetical protein [Gulosibacter sp. 10]|uniref:hypothetical protein n=1 Tax=Gulosibacter sp. 10 TaxID=1255570 RepID=UPI00097EFB52|nr:hypothetical protein [Gulosibacter sp. 10]SJM57262.1 hypothetical protein FM112_05155 [Gulosibacter sp. 10]
MRIPDRLRSGIESIDPRPLLRRARASGAALLRHDRLRDDRGDVPGWVLVALMSAGLVILLWTLAGPLLSDVFQSAIDRVTANF